MMEYITAQGDTWDIISKKCYSSEHYIDVLMNANFEYLDYFIFPAGLLLKIPNATVNDSYIPDWRR